jgi:ferredoxin
MTHVVTERCYRCRFTNCVVVCPAPCFHDGQRMLYIHPDECIDCEACVPECPAAAIFREDKLAEADRPFRDLNAAMAYQTPPVRARKL